MRCVVRSSARLRRRGSSVHLDNYERDGGGGHDGHGRDNSIGEEEGEIMVSMQMDHERRIALERWHRAGGVQGRDERRLSRELEEGFMDDSSDGS